MPVFPWERDTYAMSRAGRRPGQDSGGRSTFAMAESTRVSRAAVARGGNRSRTSRVSAGTAEDAGETGSMCEQKKWPGVDRCGRMISLAQPTSRRSKRLDSNCCLDDHAHAGPYSADLVLNQNLHRERGLYARTGSLHHSCFWGRAHAMLRREFRQWRTGGARSLRSDEKFLVTDEEAAIQTIYGKSDRSDPAGFQSNLETTVLVAAASRISGRWRN